MEILLILPISFLLNIFIKNIKFDPFVFVSRLHFIAEDLFRRKGNPENKNGFWIDCHKKDNTFIGMGSVDSLEKILSIFFEWCEQNCDTSGWDETVNTIIRQLESCNDVNQLRKMYGDIDSIPAEHTRKQELMRLFEVKWDYLINNTPN